MPATIVQTNDTPFATVAIDPVTLDIIENALRNARIEMDATLVRTAMSPGIREQGGPSIDELRASSQADTGLAAPIQPRWTRRETTLSIAAE